MTVGIVVTVHELGHYLTARWCRVGIETFSIGIGRTLVGWYDRAGTFWKIGLLPFGGYVRMFDLENHSLLSRILVVLAGPIANFLFSMVVVTTAFMFIGSPVSKPIIGYVAPDTPAAFAGLMPNDQVLMLDNISVTSFEQMRSIIGDRAGKTIAILIDRDGVHKQLPATIGSRDGYGILGVTPATERRGLGRALVEGPLVTWLLTKATVVGLFHIHMSDVSGPVGIAQASGEAVQQGWMMWLWLVVMLSISLGVFNLIPLPILDGGRLVYYLIEAILGHPLSQRVQSIGMVTSSLMLFGLFLFVTWHDISRWLFG